jgi:DNA-binding NtrC family response regulator
MKLLGDATDVTTTGVNTTPFTARRQERRQGLHDLLRTLAQTLADGSDRSPLGRVFEDALRRLLPFRDVLLRQATAPSDRAVAALDAEAIAFEVPGPNARGVLEATFDPSCGLGDWDFQLLAAAANLGSFVLEIDRARAQIARMTSASARPRRDGAAPLIGSTPAMQTLRSKIQRVAATDFTVLLEGESGVGKELVARQIHELSDRRGGPFVAVNCAALVETLLEAELFGIEDRTATGVRGRRGKFEHADGGTLFLDEVSDLSLSAQAKLLRAIQDLAVERVGGSGSRRVDIRIVAATNRSLANLVERGLFRTDLFYRLGGVDIHVPALRERRADILELARYFLERHRATRSLRLSAAASDALASYHWPGNVRELERLMERAIALATGPLVEIDDLPPCVRGDYSTALLPSIERNETMRTWQGRYARLVFERCGKNKRQACRVLRISYHTLVSYLRYPVDSGAERPDAHWTPAIARADKRACASLVEA